MRYESSPPPTNVSRSSPLPSELVADKLSIALFEYAFGVFATIHTTSPPLKETNSPSVNVPLWHRSPGSPRPLSGSRIASDTPHGRVTLTASPSIRKSALSAALKRSGTISEVSCTSFLTLSITLNLNGPALTNLIWPSWSLLLGKQSYPGPSTGHLLLSLASTNLCKLPWKRTRMV